MTAKRPGAKPLQDKITVYLHVTGHELQLFREWMAQTEHPTPAAALRALVSAALADDDLKRAIVRWGRRTEFVEFRRSLYIEWLTHLKQIEQQVQDELAILQIEESTNVHQT